MPDMNFSDNLIIIAGIAFFAWLFYTKNQPVSDANNTVPFWYTLAGAQPKMFDYASQSNYLQEASDQHGF